MSHSAATETALPRFADEEFMFSNRKWVYKPRIEKRQRKLLAKIPALQNFLRPNERVMLATTCCSPTSMLEQLTTGWIVFYINRALLVITDQRILHIPTTTNYSYRDSIAQIDYRDCRAIRIRGRHMLVHYRNGKKERFLYLGADRAKLKDYFKMFGDKHKDAQDPVPQQTAGRLHLCPRCTMALPEGKYQCRGCYLDFKDMNTATRLSLALPGGGYFYTGHWFLGLSDLLVEAALLLLILGTTYDAAAGEPGAWGAAAFFAILLGLEKALTVYHARRYIREYIPKDKAVSAVSIS